MNSGSQRHTHHHCLMIWTGSQEVQHSFMNYSICSNHEECEGRHLQLKCIKNFTAKEFVKGHPVNAVKGLRLYEDVFSESQLCKLTDFVKEIHAAGQNGELPGETFILYNKQVKGNKREMIQLGVPLFGQIKDNTKSNIEPIPPLLEGVIDHLIQWQIIWDDKRPNGCIINFFDEGEFSQPFFKPPHVDQPLSTLLLSESTMAFGRFLMSENDGNYKGPLMLSLKQGVLSRVLAEEGYTGVEIRVTPIRTEIIIKATRTQAVLGEKGRRIRELTTLIQKRFNFPENSVQLYAEKVSNRGLCAAAQAESLRYKLLGGLAVRRACYGVLRFVMESGAKGCEVIVSGKLRAQRAKSMKFKEGYFLSSGQPVKDYIDSAVRHVLLRQGVLGIKVKIMLEWDPKGKHGPKTPLPDIVTIHTPKEEEECNRPAAILPTTNIEVPTVA